jgi:hypothetical protein
MTTPEWPSALPTPLQDGYGLRRGVESLSIRLRGGASRVRRDIVGASHVATCTFLCFDGEYSALIGWFRERVQSRTALFRLPLLVDTPVPVNHLCRVLDEPEELADTRGGAHTVRVTLELLPNPMRSFSLLLQNVSDTRVSDTGSSDYAGDMGEFPIGRDVMLLGCSGFAASTTTFIDLDGTYEIASKPSASAIVLLNAAVVNPGWTTLAGTASQALIPNTNGAANFAGACILLPE